MKDRFYMQQEPGGPAPDSDPVTPEPLPGSNPDPYPVSDPVIDPSPEPQPFPTPPEPIPQFPPDVTF